MLCIIHAGAVGSLDCSGLPVDLRIIKAFSCFVGNDSLSGSCTSEDSSGA